MASICRDEHMPAVQTVSDWALADPKLAGSIARARLDGFDALAAECLDIANTPLEGTETEESEAGTKIKRGDMLGHRKLQIETRLKLLAKWDPKRYGERIQNEISNPDGSLQLTDTDRAAKIAAIFAAAAQRKTQSEVDEDVSDLV